MRLVPEQDYLALNEMPSNDEASVMYAVPTASAADAVSVPEPTNVGGGGTALLGASATRMDAGDDDMRWPELLIIRNQTALVTGALLLEGAS